MSYILQVAPNSGTGLPILIGITIWFIIIYYVIKLAVKNGIIEAKRESAKQSGKGSNSDLSNDARYTKLRQQYESGKITFEQYQSEWEKLSS